MTEDRPGPRSWKTRLLLRAAHSYFLMTRAMTLGVRAACFDAAGNVFLVKHSYVPGWQMPGGGLELGETAGAALERELREEGGLAMSQPPQLFHVYFNSRTSRRDHVIFYRCNDVTQTKAKLPDREIIDSGFFALDALPNETTAATRRRLAELSGAAPPADIW